MDCLARYAIIFAFVITGQASADTRQPQSSQYLRRYVMSGIHLVPDIAADRTKVIPAPNYLRAQVVAQDVRRPGVRSEAIHEHVPKEDE